MKTRAALYHGPLLVLSCALTAAAATTAGAADQTAREVAARAPALADAAQAACTAVTRPGAPAPLEIESAIRDARAAVSAAVTSDETVPAAAPILTALASRIGDLDQVPSVELQMLRNALASSAGDRERLIEGRAFAQALLRHIEGSGDGATPGTAWHPCLVSNEYAFVQQVLRAQKVTQQALLHEDGRHYDKLTLTMADGSTRDVFFDITDIFRRNGESLLR